MIVVSTAVWLIIAAALQGALAARLSIYWATPDFLLVVAVVLSMHRSTDAAAFTGFFAGLLHGAVLNDHMMAFIISRVIACAVAAKMAASSIGAPYLTLVLVTLVASGVSSVLYLFFGVQKDILGWLTATIGGAFYNGVLAIPCYWLYRLLARPAVAK